VANAKKRMKNRDEIVDGMWVTALAGEYGFLYGAPGEGKTMAAEMLATSIDGGTLFVHGGHAGATADEILGPINVPRLRDFGVMERNTEGMLTDSDMFLLDEAPRNPQPTLNACLRPFSERTFQGKKIKPVAGFMAANNLPVDLIGATAGKRVPMDVREETSEAFMDRVFYKIEVPSVAAGSDDWCDIVFDDCSDEDDGARISRAEIEFLQTEVKRVVWGAAARESLRSLAVMLSMGDNDVRPVKVSTRSWRKARKMVSAVAVFNGRSAVKPKDLRILRDCLWVTPDQRRDIDKAVTLCLPPAQGEAGLVTAKFRDLMAAFEQAKLALDPNTDTLVPAASPLAITSSAYFAAAGAFLIALRAEIREQGVALANAEDEEDRVEIEACVSALQEMLKKADRLHYKAKQAR
jgi:MoxR-like ATPase